MHGPVTPDTFTDNQICEPSKTSQAPADMLSRHKPMSSQLTSAKPGPDQLNHPADPKIYKPLSVSVVFRD